MDPISTAASVITLLGAAAGTIKVVHDTINSIIDAPNDIKRQSERLGHISITLASVVHACEQLPDDCHLDLELRGIGELIEDAKLLEAKLNTRGTRMMRNNFSKIHGSCKWLLADRQFKRFFESLDQWNTILLQTLGVIQLTLLKRIYAQTSSLTSLPHLTLPVPPIAPQIAMKTHFDMEIQATASKNAQQNSMQSSHTRNNWFASLAKLAEPVGVLLQYHHHVQVSGIDLALSGGRLIMKRWSSSGKETHATLSQWEGHQSSLIMSMPYITSRRLEVSVAGFRTRSCDPTLNFRWTLRYHRILAYDHPYFVAIERGDIGYLQNQLSSRTLCLSDCILGGHSLLHYAVRRNRPAIVTMLIAEGLDVNVQNDRGQTPLHVAVQQGKDFNCARLLLEHGADAFQQDNEGRSALHYFYNEVVRQHLLYYADDIDPWMQDRSGMTVLHWASWSRSSSHQAFVCIPDKAKGSSCYGLKDVYGKSMLHYAVQRGNADLIAFFLASPDAAAMSMPDFSGKSLLHYATESGRPEMIDMMLERGIDLDTIDDQGRTVLHHAAMRGNLVATQRLIQLGATHQLSYKDHNNQTPADLACQYASEAVQDYFETLGHSGIDGRKRDVCLPSETASSGQSADRMSWNIALLMLLAFATMYWSSQLNARREISVA